MKTLLFNLLLSLASGPEATVADDFRGALHETSIEWTTDVTAVMDSKVKIFDEAGNLLMEVNRADLETLSADDRKLVAKSAFMFDYLGDSYFMLEN